MNTNQSNFTDDAKIKLATMIIENYFNRNFGSMSKCDLETLLFSEYYNNRKSNNLHCDDYSISKELGITQSRVRVLKERKELKYPQNEIWPVNILSSIKKAKFDSKANKVVCFVEDINVMIEARHKIESMGWFDECSLNKKLMVLSPECFFELCADIEKHPIIFSEEIKQKCSDVVSQIKIRLKSNNIKKLLENFNLSGLAQFLYEEKEEEIVKKINGIMGSNSNCLTNIWKKFIHKKSI